MATIRLLLGIICFAALGSYRLPDRHLLSADTVQRERLLKIARQEVGVRELIGNNDGERVEGYLTAVGLRKGQPWCAAFISWIFKEGGYDRPRTGWSPDLFNKKVNTTKVLPAQVFGIWFPKLKRIAHVGMIEKQEGDWIISIEGNTNIAGSREGDGVYRKRRLVKGIHAYADWISEEEVQP